MKKSTLKKFMLTFLSVIALSAVMLSACTASCGIYFNTLDWAVALIQEYYYEDIPEEEIREAGLENLDSLLDAYSRYYTAEEYDAVEASNEGSRSGIGITYQYIPSELGLSMGSGVFIASVLGNSPARKSGLRAGMFVRAAVASDGTRTEISSRDDFTNFIDARADGEQFTLVTDQGEYTMSKQNYTTSYCYMASCDTEWTITYNSFGVMSVEENQSDYYSYLPEGTAYVALSQFYGNAPDEMAALFSVFNKQGFDSLIFDLRQNGGGYVSVMQKLGWLFTANSADASTVAMYAEYKNGSRDYFNIDRFTSDETCYLPADTDVTILADNGTASASEALIGVLVSAGVADYSDIYVSDFGDAYLQATGTAEKDCRTYGKGIMQTTFTYIFTGEALRLTTARIYWPNDVCIHDVGIGVNDGCKTVETEWSMTYGDSQLQTVAGMM